MPVPRISDNGDDGWLRVFNFVEARVAMSEPAGVVKHSFKVFSEAVASGARDMDEGELHRLLQFCHTQGVPHVSSWVSLSPSSIFAQRSSQFGTTVWGWTWMWVQFAA